MDTDMMDINSDSSNLPAHELLSRLSIQQPSEDESHHQQQQGQEQEQEQYQRRVPRPRQQLSHFPPVYQYATSSSSSSDTSNCVTLHRSIYQQPRERSYPRSGGYFRLPRLTPVPFPPSFQSFNSAFSSSCSDSDEESQNQNFNFYADYTSWMADKYCISIEMIGGGPEGCYIHGHTNPVLFARWDGGGPIPEGKDEFVVRRMETLDMWLSHMGYELGDDYKPRRALPPSPEEKEQLRREWQQKQFEKETREAGLFEWMYTDINEQYDKAYEDDLISSAIRPLTYCMGDSEGRTLWFGVSTCIFVEVASIPRGKLRKVLELEEEERYGGGDGEEERGGEEKYFFKVAERAMECVKEIPGKRIYVTL